MKNSATSAPRTPANCNCQTTKKTVCPMPGKCNQDGVVYQATITSDGGRSENYVGLDKNFKKRWGKHKSTLKDKNTEGIQLCQHITMKKKMQLETLKLNSNT